LTKSTAHNTRLGTSPAGVGRGAFYKLYLLSRRGRLPAGWQGSVIRFDGLRQAPGRCALYHRKFSHV